jgi:GNAT superfamily N-acetyltransferase
MQIADITLNDLEELKELQPDGWPNIEPHYQFYISSSFCKPIKISVNGDIAGIGASILHKSTAWLGHIIVHKEFRNRGIGTAVTRTLCERLSNNIESISLIATQPGEPVYQKLGFKKETEYYFFKNELVKKLVYEAECIKDGYPYIAQILQMDKVMSGEDRTLLLSGHLQDSKVFIYRDRVMGFYLPTLGEGLIVATDKSAGIELLKLRLQNKSVSILPRENQTCIDFLTANNFEFYQKGTRMSLRRTAGFKPEMLFNRIAGNLG